MWVTILQGCLTERFTTCIELGNGQQTYVIPINNSHGVWNIGSRWKNSFPCLLLHVFLNYICKLLFSFFFRFTSHIPPFHGCKTPPKLVYCKKKKPIWKSNWNSIKNILKVQNDTGEQKKPRFWCLVLKASKMMISETSWEGSAKAVGLPPRRPCPGSHHYSFLKWWDPEKPTLGRL